MPRRVYEQFFHPGEVVEIRAIGGMKGKSSLWSGWAGGQKPVVAGYFDNAAAFHEAANGLDKAGAHGVYFTLNPVDPALIARASNRLSAEISTTSDKDVKCIRWLPIDLDPVRVSGVSSTNEELERAKGVARQIAERLEDKYGFPPGIRAMSGNGYHILYRLKDLENDDTTEGKMKKLLWALARDFTSDTVMVDEKVFNPARIWKLYGTTGRKGDNTQDRPHRRSILYNPVKLDEVPCVEDAAVR